MAPNKGLRSPRGLVEGEGHLQLGSVAPIIACTGVDFEFENIPLMDGTVQVEPDSLGLSVRNGAAP